MLKRPQRTASALTLAVIVVSAVLLGWQHLRPLGTGDVANTTWDVIGVEPTSLGTFEATDLVRSPANWAQISFDQLGQFELSASGCHYLSGHYGVDGRALVTGDVRAQLIGCGPVQDDSDWWFARFLATSPAIGLETDHLALVSSSTRVDLAPHSEAVGWWLDPSYPVRPETRLLHVVLYEGACASGRSPEGRILPPTIDYGADSISISVRVRTLTMATCQGNAPYAWTIVLSQPVGNRTLLNHGLPPVPVS